MNSETPYFRLQDQKYDVALGYFLSRVIRSRVEIGIESGGGIEDEDVNVYLAFLLLAFSDPSYLSWARTYEARSDFDLASELTQNSDHVRCFLMYKVNADRLLMDGSIFQSRDIEYVGQASTYYGLASSYHRQIYRRSTGLSDVLDKLSLWLERYLTILHHLSGEYLSFVEGIRDDSFDELLSGAEQLKEKLQLQDRQDALLDVYALWLRTQDMDLWPLIEGRARAVQAIDPHFNFSPKIMPGVPEEED